MRPGCCSCTAEWRSWWLIWGLWYGHSGVCNLMIYLVMDGHRKLVVHNYRNLMVATMMYCTATGTWISYRTLNCDIQELCHPECPKPTIVQNKTNQIRQRIISKACRLAENLFQSIFILHSDTLHCRKFIEVKFHIIFLHITLLDLQWSWVISGWVGQCQMWQTNIDPHHGFDLPELPCRTKGDSRLLVSLFHGTLGRVAVYFRWTSA